MDEDTKKEIAARTEWRKYIVFERKEEIFSEDSFAGVFCIREVSGYGVWYMRKLSTDADEEKEINGKYLLRFFAPEARHEAIEFAVVTAGIERDSDVALRRLDDLAKSALRVQARESIGPMFEQVR
jgi:hypothetical protein